MSLLGFSARNHPQQVRRRGPRPAVDDRATAPELFRELDGRFRFTLDVSASADNAKCARYFSVEDDGLAQTWAGERVWCNPPYSDIRPWVEKAWCELQAGAEVIVMLLPANRTEQGWWQDLVEPFRDGRNDLGGDVRVEFLLGRRRFVRSDATGIGPNERPPFGVCLLIWEHR